MGEVVDFSLEPTKQQLPPASHIQGLTIIDLPNTYANPPLPSSNLRIIDVDGDGQNELFISQGRLRAIPNPKWDFEIKIGVVAAPFAGGPGSITVYAYDCNGNQVDKTANTNTQKYPEKVLVIGPKICYIEIEGVEASIEKIYFGE
jgi:hypothetical protein